MEKRILVVDDDRLVREMSSDVLVQEGFRVVTAASGVEALEYLVSEGPVDVLLTDLSMREIDGFELMETVKRQSPLTEVVVLTGYASLETALQAMRLGASDYLRKPATGPEIVYCVKRTLLRRKLREENEVLRGCIRAFEASRTLASCLETADILPLTLDILMRLIGRDRAVGRLVHGSQRPSEGIYLRGFPPDQTSLLRSQIQLGKIFDPTSLESPSPRTSAGLQDQLAQLGLEEPDLLALPLRLEGRVVGGIWIFPEGRPLDEDQLRRAELVMAQAELALINAERFVQAREKAFIDDVTGLYNARYLLSALDRELSRAERSKRQLSVLFLDLDRFKLVNDRHGHLVGSRVLCELGHLLHHLVRTIDTVGRYGGDEFSVLLVDTGFDGAMAVAERIRETVSSTAFGGERGLQLSLTVSVGVASFPDHAGDAETLLDLSDKAMYLGKSQGRNKCCSANELSLPPVPLARADSGL